MMVDTAALRAQAMDDIDNLRDLTGRSDLGPREVISLLDALDKARERVRVLTELLVGANDDINHVRVRTQRDAYRLYAAKDKIGRAVRALTAVGEDGSRP